MIAVKYIGHRKSYRDGACGSGLVFEQGQTQSVEDEIARKMLKHKDVYVPGDLTEAEAVGKPAKAPKSHTTDEDPDQTARDAIANMTKDALVTYAKNTFSVDLDKRTSVGDMRTRVTGLFDQFGTD